MEVDREVDTSAEDMAVVGTSAEDMAVVGTSAVEDMVVVGTSAVEDRVLVCQAPCRISSERHTFLSWADPSHTVASA